MAPSNVAFWGTAALASIRGLGLAWGLHNRMEGERLTQCMV